MLAVLKADSADNYINYRRRFQHFVMDNKVLLQEICTQAADRRSHVIKRIKHSKCSMIFIFRGGRKVF